MKFILVATLVTYHAAFAENDAVDHGALDMDDVCTSGEDCEVSLRQLRGLKQTGQALQQAAGDTVVPPALAEEADGTESPKYNYNWNFGCSSEKKEAPPASDDIQFNYNWNFCFEDASTDQQAAGDCSAYGCTAAFDFAKISNKCQCFPGCEATFVGNICCPDFKSTCQASPEKKPVSKLPEVKLLDDKFTAYASAACNSLQGAVVLHKGTSDLASCAERCDVDSKCEGLAYSLQGQECKILSAINIPACQTEERWSTFVKKAGDKPPACRKYMSTTGCGWTRKWSCPGQPRGSVAEAGDDGTHGFNCCCNLGMWKNAKPALPAGTPLRIVNKFSGRVLFAKPGRYWEDGCGAGTPAYKVHDDGVWTLVPQEQGQYRIVNQRSNRALYAKVGENWEAGWGGGAPEKVTDDGLWKIEEDEDDGYRIINVKSNRALFARAGGPGELSWSLGCGAGSPPSSVTKDGIWKLEFLS